MDCGSGFPAANRLTVSGADRGWPRQVGMQAKAAPTIKPKPKILKLMSMRLGWTGSTPIGTDHRTQI
jgi:hypothetical protein